MSADTILPIDLVKYKWVIGMLSGPIRNVLVLSPIEMSYLGPDISSPYNPFRHG
jgi:hypothetical protein